MFFEELLIARDVFSFDEENLVVQTSVHENFNAVFVPLPVVVKPNSFTTVVRLAALHAYDDNFFSCFARHRGGGLFTFRVPVIRKGFMKVGKS
jgi:hypothetical protein